jgi:hypothetical protein
MARGVRLGTAGRGASLAGEQWKVGPGRRETGRVQHFLRSLLASAGGSSNSRRCRAGPGPAARSAQLNPRPRARHHSSLTPAPPPARPCNVSGYNATGARGEGAGRVGKPQIVRGAGEGSGEGRRAKGVKQRGSGATGRGRQRGVRDERAGYELPHGSFAAPPPFLFPYSPCLPTPPGWTE